MAMGARAAWRWARERHGDDAAVIGADIRLVDCMDLLDVSWNEVLFNSYGEFIRHRRAIGRAAPTQSGGAHTLDREVINYAVSVLEDSGTHISCVRSAFPEGRPVYPGSAIYDRWHVQIAVRDTEACISRIWRESRGP